MNIVRELKPDAPFSEIMSIFKKGHKVAIAMRSTTVVGSAESTWRDDGQGGVLEDFNPDTPTECIPGIFINQDDITFRGGDTLVVMDTALTGKEGCSFEFKPFTGDKSGYVCNFSAYDDRTGTIADRVVEVEV